MAEGEGRGKTKKWRGDEFDLRLEDDTYLQAYSRTVLSNHYGRQWCEKEGYGGYASAAGRAFLSWTKLKHTY